MNEKKNQTNLSNLEELVALIQYHVFVKPCIKEIRTILLDEIESSDYAAELILRHLISKLLKWRKCNEDLFFAAKNIIPSNAKLDQAKEQYLKNCDISHESLMLCAHWLIVNNYLEELIENEYKLLKTICSAKFYILEGASDLVYSFLQSKDFLKQPFKVILNILNCFSYGGYPIVTDVHSELLSMGSITLKHLQFMRFLYEKHHSEIIKFQLREGGFPNMKGGSRSDDSKKQLNEPLSSELNQGILLNERKALKAKWLELKTNLAVNKQQINIAKNFRKPLLIDEDTAIYAMTEAKLQELSEDYELNKQRLTTLSQLIKSFGILLGEPVEKPPASTQPPDPEEGKKLNNPR